MQTTQSFAGWKRAFDRAINTEAEGAKHFEGFLKKLKKNDESPIFLEDKSSSIGTALSEPLQREKFRPTYSGEVEKEIVERGGFCQPANLASFFKKGKSEEDAATLSVPKWGNVEEIKIASLSETSHNLNIDKGNGVQRQICRAWLKNTYLQLGSPCNNVSCDRRHLIESKSLGSLYKDYSFKGLTTAQRNSITNQVRLAAIITTTTTTTTTTIVAVVSSEAATAVIKPIECKVEEKMGTASKKVVVTATSDFNHLSTDVTEHDIIPITTTEIISENAKYDGTEVDYGDHSSMNVVTGCKPRRSNQSRDIESTQNEMRLSEENVNSGQDDAQNLKVLDAAVKSGPVHNFQDYEHATSGAPPGRLRERIKIIKKPWMPIHKKITY